jgi:DNA-binding NarL/FixJ family response regulator
MRIFIVDDEDFSRATVRDFLEKQFPELTISEFSTGEAALKELRKKPEVIILDYYLNLQNDQADNGIEILKKIKANLPDTKVILFSGQDSYAIATDTIKYGAYDYIVKGESAMTRLDLLIRRILGYKTMKPGTKPGLSRGAILLLVIILLFLIAAFYFRH